MAKKQPEAERAALEEALLSGSLPETGAARAKKTLRSLITANYEVNFDTGTLRPKTDPRQKGQ
jgi:hypothetical protein